MRAFVFMLVAVFALPAFGAASGRSIRMPGVQTPPPPEQIGVDQCVDAEAGLLWVVTNTEYWPIDCERYPLGGALDQQTRTTRPVYRHVGADGGHRLSVDGVSRPGEEAPEVAFYAPAVGYGDQTVYGYRHRDGQWMYGTSRFYGWADYGFEEEVVLFDVIAYVEHTPPTSAPRTR